MNCGIEVVSGTTVVDLVGLYFSTISGAQSSTVTWAGGRCRHNHAVTWAIVSASWSRPAWAGRGYAACCFVGFRRCYWK